MFLASSGVDWTATWPNNCWPHLGRMAHQLGVVSFFSGRTEKHVRTWDSRAYRIPILVGAVLLTPWNGASSGEKTAWQVGTGGYLSVAVLTLARHLVPWWARIHLGRFWSNAITRKGRPSGR